MIEVMKRNKKLMNAVLLTIILGACSAMLFSSMSSTGKATAERLFGGHAEDNSIELVDTRSCSVEIE